MAPAHRQSHRRACSALTVAQAKKDFDYDLIIIGCGVGGHGAALHAVECVSAQQCLRMFPGLSRISSNSQKAAFRCLGFDVQYQSSLA